MGNVHVDMRQSKSILSICHGFFFRVRSVRRDTSLVFSNANTEKMYDRRDPRRLAGQHGVKEVEVRPAL